MFWPIGVQRILSCISGFKFATTCSPCSVTGGAQAGGWQNHEFQILYNSKAKTMGWCLIFGVAPTHGEIVLHIKERSHTTEVSSIGNRRVITIISESMSWRCELSLRQKFFDAVADIFKHEFLGAVLLRRIRQTLTLTLTLLDTLPTRSHVLACVRCIWSTDYECCNTHLPPLLETNYTMQKEGVPLCSWSCIYRWTCLYSSGLYTWRYSNT